MFIKVGELSPVDRSGVGANVVHDRLGTAWRGGKVANERECRNEL